MRIKYHYYFFIINFILSFNKLLAGSSKFDDTWMSERFPSKSISKLYIESDSGSITIAGNATDEEISIVKFQRLKENEDNVQVVLENGILKLSNRKKGKEESVVNWVVTIPKSVSIDTVARIADINLKELTGETRIILGEGSLVSTAPLSKLLINAGQLKSHIFDLAGDSIFKISIGEMILAWTIIPTKTRNLMFQLGIGVAHIYAPEGATVNIDDLVASSRGKMNSDEIFQKDISDLRLVWSVIPIQQGFKKRSEFSSSSDPSFRISGSGIIGALNVNKSFSLKARL